MGLTLKRIAKLTKQPGRYHDGGGLHLQVPRAGEKQPRQTRASWLLRYELRGKEHWMGLGALRDFTLEEARERARRARQQLADGIDPLAARAAEKAARALEAAKSMTFEDAARAYFAAHAPSWSNAKTGAQFLNTLRDYVFPRVGRLAVSAIDTGEVLRCIEPHWRDKAPTMNRTRGRIEAILDWATVRGYRTGDNPARWRGHLSEVLPAPGKVAKTAHHAAMPYAELPQFLSTLREQQGVAARALEFLVLTAARTGEVTNATSSEIDLEAKTWVIPPARMKGGKEHRVPLSPQAVALLRELPREAEFVFVGASAGKPISSMAMARTLKRLRPDVVVHGFRSSFSTWAHETTGYSNHVIELSLAHSVGNAVEKSYRRGDLFEKRRRLMNDWARFCFTKPPAQATKGEVVVPIRTA
jgi:integrase